MPTVSDRSYVALVTPLLTVAPGLTDPTPSLERRRDGRAYECGTPFNGSVVAIKAFVLTPARLFLDAEHGNLTGLDFGSAHLCYY